MLFSTVVDRLQAATRDRLTRFLPGDPEITGIAPIDAAPTGTLSYIEGPRYARHISTTAASALILPEDAAVQAQASDRALPWVAGREPRLLFARAIAEFYQPYRPAPGIHPTAAIDPSAQMGADVSIGAHVSIAADVAIGDRVCIHPNVVIYPQVEIGARTILHANCAIAERTQIGPDCTIHSGAVIGSEGFGFVPTPDGWYKMEQSGRVVLEAGVEIGSNSTVDRPAVGETRIGRQTKLDNLVHVGHSCQIGFGCALAAQVGLAGGVVVGDRVLLGGQVGVANQVRIGDGARATAQTGITRDVKPGAVVSGTPAMSNRLYLKAGAIYKRLPELYRWFKENAGH